MQKCKECQKELKKNNTIGYCTKHKMFSAKQKEIHKKATQKYYSKNKEKILLKAREWEKNNIERKKKTVRDWTKRNKEKVRGYGIKHKFNLSFEDYKIIVERQNNLCAICNTKEDNRELAVDHNHKTGEIRGLLCIYCNWGIGHLRDDIKLLKKAIIYLKKYEQKKRNLKTDNKR